MGVGKSIVEIIGNTPIVRLNRSIPNDVKAEILGKCEFMNPTGSIKDRIAIYMLDKALKEGKLKPGMKILVPTTGNTGIAFAALGAALGFKVIITIPEEMSKERFMLLKLLGAEIMKVPGGELGVMDALKYAHKIASEKPDEYWVADQFDDESNVQAHYETTGKEILEQIGKVDVWIAGIGTGGTLVGVAKRLKEANPKTLVIGLEPSEAPAIFEGRVGEHGIEGIGDGFTPNIVARYKHLIDDYVLVSTDEAIKMARTIARMEGLPIGISSGANIAGAIKIARRYDLKTGSKIVTVLPDYAARYFSTRLFEE